MHGSERSSTPTPPTRWEDRYERWVRPKNAPRRLQYVEEVELVDLAAGLWACPEPVDWGGDIGPGLLVSAWDTCYEGTVKAYRWVTVTAREKCVAPEVEYLGDIDGVYGFVTSQVIDGELFLVGCSRTSLIPLLWRQRRPGSLEFEGPVPLALPAPWRKGELPHVARLVKWRDDGKYYLLVGTDYWGDYWPEGKEWFEADYHPWNSEGLWRGGPIRGWLYLFEPATLGVATEFKKVKPIEAAGKPVEVYGAAAPAVRLDERGVVAEIFCGSFLDRISHFVRIEAEEFEARGPIRDTSGNELILEHCVHIPAWWAGRPGWCEGLLVGREDGLVTYLAHRGGNRFEEVGFLRVRKTYLRSPAMAVPSVGRIRPAHPDDVVVGVSSGHLIYYKSSAIGEAGPVYHAGKRVRAQGKEVRLMAGFPGTIQGPAEVKFGYASPVVFDWDDDGLLDLIVTDAQGLHYWLRNSGSASEPKFDPPRVIYCGGRPLKTVWRVRPAVYRDGSRVLYLCLNEEGTLSLFIRINPDEVRFVTYPCFVDGNSVRFTEDRGGGLGRVKLVAVDWYNSGAVDLIVGTHARASVPPGPRGIPLHTHKQATVLLMENVGSNDHPVYRLPKQVCSNGEPLRLGMHECAPEVVYWSGDLPDLLVGVESGDLLYFPRRELSTV